MTTKISRNKYARERDGELMLVHRCAGCGQLAINRVAADDIAENLLAIFARSWALGPELRDAVVRAGIDLLTLRDRAGVQKAVRGVRASAGARQGSYC